MLTKEQLHILQHSIGVDKYGQGEMYRNHFCAGADDEPTCRELVAMGYMWVFRPNESPYPYYNCAVTEEGKEAVRRESPPAPKLTRSQNRYRESSRGHGRKFQRVAEGSKGGAPMTAMFECFDTLKRPIPCPVVAVPEPLGAGGWELLIAGVGIALALWMARRWGWR